jgi:hypothetical protein
MKRQENKSRKRNQWLILCAVGVAIIVALVLIIYALTTPKLVETVTSPDGKKQLSVHQRPDKTTYTIEDRAIIQGVQEYCGLYFSSDSRYYLFVYEDLRDGQQFFLKDYQNILAGGANPELACKTAPDFREELTKYGMWVSIAFHFQKWHETENLVLLSYTYTLLDGREVTGEIWWNVEEQSVSKK